MSAELAQFVAVDCLLHAATYLRKQAVIDYKPFVDANLKAQIIIYDAMSKVLDEVDEVTQ